MQGDYVLMRAAGGQVNKPTRVMVYTIDPATLRVRTRLECYDWGDAELTANAITNKVYVDCNTVGKYKLNRRVSLPVLALLN